MQVGARAVGPQFQKLDALKTETDNRPLFCVLVAFVPNASLCRQQLRILSSETIETWATQAIFSIDKESQRDRQLAEGFLIGFNRGHASNQIALAVGRPAGVKLAIDDRRRKRPY